MTARFASLSAEGANWATAIAVVADPRAVTATASLFASRPRITAGATTHMARTTAVRAMTAVIAAGLSTTTSKTNPTTPTSRTETVTSEVIKAA